VRPPRVPNALDTAYGSVLPGSVTTAVAGVAGGTFGAVVSQPFDTIKTRMQAFMWSKPEYLTMRSTMATIYAEGGISRFWAGLLPRATRIIGATFLLNAVRSKVVGYLEDARKPQ